METLETAYTRKKAEIIITGLERPLNRHLVKLKRRTWPRGARFGRRPASASAT